MFSVILRNHTWCKVKAGDDVEGGGERVGVQNGKEGRKGEREGVERKGLILVSR